MQFEGTSIVHTLWSKPRMLYNASGAAWVQFLTLCMIVHCIHKDEISSLVPSTVTSKVYHKEMSEELPESTCQNCMLH